MSNTTFDMHRPVLNFTEDSVEGLYTEVIGRGVSEDQIRRLGRTTSKVVILGSGDLTRFLERTGIEASPENMDDLSEYLELHMPDSADRELAVPSYPFGEHIPYGKKPTTQIRTFTLGTNNPIVREERATALSLVEGFFDVNVDRSDIWPTWDYMAEVWLARSYGLEAAATFRNVLTAQPELLPDSIALGAVALDVRTN